MEPLFQVDDGIGLDRPPVGELGPGEALGAPIPAQPAQPVNATALLICPSCGCPNCDSQGSKDPAVQMADEASVVTCPDCQAQFEPPCEQPGDGAGLALPMESSTTRILGRVFERHVRRHAHALKRGAGKST